MSHCAIECCPQEPVVRLSYVTRPPRSYLLCGDHRVEAQKWVRSRFGPDITITEDEPEAVQPAIVSPDEVMRT